MGEEFIGTGRMNRTGGGTTITAPKKMREIWDIDENGLDVAWFYDGKRLFATRQSDISVER